MTDFFTDFSLGDVVIKRASQVVEYNATITKGQGLNIESVNADGQAVVGVSTSSEKVQFVAMFDGVDGNLEEALSWGQIVITYGGAVAAGAMLKAGTAGKFVSASRATAADIGVACGTNLTAAAADNDTGLIEFMGGVTP